MTKEEMVQTQVLNLADVQKAAAEEKKRSKKLPILIAIIGIVSILGGVVTSFITKEDVKGNASGATTEEKQTTPQETDSSNQESDLSTNIPTTTQLSCSLTAQANTDGTDTTMNYIFTFDDTGLTQYLKSYTATINSTSDLETGKKSIQRLGETYSSLNANRTGYVVSTEITETSLSVNTSIDFANYNEAEVPEGNKTIEQTSVDYAKGSQKEEIRQALTAKQYTCSE